jgi:hypothetical protein
MFERRRKSRDYKVLSHNQVLLYDRFEDCYLHRHHSTVTVKIFPTYYVVNTGGWDTVTTWRKIHECVNISTGKPHLASIVENKMVFWNGWGMDRKFCPYYDGIKVDHDGIPLEPQPTHFRRMKKGATAPFNRVAHRVREQLQVRALVGEWDTAEASLLEPNECWALMQEIAKKRGWVSNTMAAPLFARRERQIFGRTGKRWGSSVDEEEFRNSVQRLQTTVACARRYWISKNNGWGSEIYEQYTKECF